MATLAAVAATLPLKRPATAEEVAAPIVWLLSNEASFVSGARLDVSRVAEEKARRARISKMKEAAEELEKWAEQPIYWLLAQSPSGTKMPTNFFEWEGVKGLVAGINSRAGIRRHGFNLSSHLSGSVPAPATVESGLAEIEQGRVFAVTKELDCVVGATPTNHYLGDFMAREVGRTEIANGCFVAQIALVELTYEFFRAIERELKPRTSPGTWLFGAECVRFQSNKVHLWTSPYSPFPPKPVQF